MLGTDWGGAAGFIADAAYSGAWVAAGFVVWRLTFLSPFGRRRFRNAVTISASPEAIWDRCFVKPEPEGGWSGGLEMVLSGFVEGEPLRRRFSCRREGAEGPFAPHVERVLLCEPPRLLILEEESLDGVAIDPSQAKRSLTTLTPRGSKTLVVREVEQPVRGLYDYLRLRRRRAQRLRRLRAICEGRPAPRAKDGIGPFYGLLFLGLAIGAGMALFSAPFQGALAPMLTFALLLQGALLTHELGHFLAMRWFGHPDARIALVPLFGGAAIGARPPGSRFEKAMIALMGPALSALALALLFPMIGWGLAFGRTFAAKHGAPDDAAELLRGLVGLLALGFAAFATLLNLLNLAPIARLDGAALIEALAVTKRGRRLYGATLFISLALCDYGAFGWRRMGGDIGFVAIAALLAPYFTAPLDPAPETPMTPREKATVLAGLALTFAAYAALMQYAVAGALSFAASTE